MSRLKFDLCDGDGKWTFENQKKEIVGWLERVRVGAYMHWVIFLREGFFLTSGCADEVRDFQRKLYSSKTGKTRK